MGNVAPKVDAQTGRIDLYDAQTIARRGDDGPNISLVPTVTGCLWVDMRATSANRPIFQKCVISQR